MQAAAEEQRCGLSLSSYLLASPRVRTDVHVECDWHLLLMGDIGGYLEALPLCQEALQLSYLLLQVIAISHEVLSAVDEALNAGALAEGPPRHLGCAADLLQSCHPYFQLLSSCLHQATCQCCESGAQDLTGHLKPFR